jgi:glutamine cyclotransferase
VGNPIQGLSMKMPPEGILRLHNAIGKNVVTINAQPGEDYELILAYSFDQRKYAQYLHGHGIKSSVVGDVTSFTQGVRTP